MADETGRLWIKECWEALPGVFPSESTAREAIRSWFDIMERYRYLTSTRFRVAYGKTSVKFELSDPVEYERGQVARYPTLAANNPEALGLPPLPGDPASSSADHLSAHRAAPVRATTCPNCRMPINPDGTHVSAGECLPY